MRRSSVVGHLKCPAENMCAREAIVKTSASGYGVSGEPDAWDWEPGAQVRCRVLMFVAN